MKIKLEKPFAGTFEEWDIWEKENRENHPVLYFLQETIPAKLRRMKQKIKDVWYWIRHRTVDKYHVDTGLKPGYYDKDMLILHACFNLLKDYVEVEKPFEHFITEGPDATHEAEYKEIRFLYNWWIVERPNRKELEWDYENFSFKDCDKPEYHKHAMDMNELEEKWNKEDEEMLIRLMKVRLHLWT